MRKVLLLASVLVSCAFAVPIQERDENIKSTLQRPSPINPDVISDPRPADKIIMVTDPEEVAQRKLQTTAKPQVTHLKSLPKHSDEDLSQESHESQAPQVPHHRQKRDQIHSKVDEKKQDNRVQQKPTVVKKPSSPISAPTKAPITSVRKPKDENTKRANNKRQRRDIVETNVGSSSSTIAPVALIHRDEHKQLHQTPHSTTPHTLPDFSNSVGKPLSRPTYRTPETITTLAALKNNAAIGDSSTRDVKRDIPVPLVAKHHHPEESTEKGEKNIETAEMKNDGTSSSSVSSSSTTTSTTPPLIRPHPVPVAELFARPKP